MPAPAEAVLALYRALGTWQRVADVCQYGRKRRHSAGYYQQVATGRIVNPSKATLAGIARAPESAERLLKRDFSKDTRKTTHVFFDDFVAGNRERIRLGLTWPEMVHLWREKYEEER